MKRCCAGRKKRTNKINIVALLEETVSSKIQVCCGPTRLQRASPPFILPLVCIRTLQVRLGPCFLLIWSNVSCLPGTRHAPKEDRTHRSRHLSETRCSAALSLRKPLVPNRPSLCNAKASSVDDSPFDPVGRVNVQKCKKN